MESTPDRIVIIDGDRIGDPQVPGGPAYVLQVVLKGELRRMHADHYHTVIPVFLRPRAHLGKGAQPIDTGVGPEVDQDDVSAQVRRREGQRIEPRGRATERRQDTFNG